MWFDGMGLINNDNAVLGFSVGLLGGKCSVSDVFTCGAANYSYKTEFILIYDLREVTSSYTTMVTFSFHISAILNFSTSPHLNILHFDVSLILLLAVRMSRLCILYHNSIG